MKQLAPPPSGPRYALLIPCYNEEVTIYNLVAEAKKIMPHLQVVVCDNQSSDNTAQLARAAGALVLHEPKQGKGYAVRRLFQAVEADYYAMLDGDATYELAKLPLLFQQAQTAHLGMVVGTRVAVVTEDYRRPIHKLGNWALSAMLRQLFQAKFTDLLSGYRIFNRAFVKSFPINTGGFTIESALAVHALQLGCGWAETPTAYRERPTGSVSKLSTWRDGWQIACYIAGLFITERPLMFWGSLGTGLIILSTFLFTPILLNYLETGFVPRFPTLMVAVSTAIMGCLFGLIGLVLQAIGNIKREARQLAFLRGGQHA